MKPGTKVRMTSAWLRSVGAHAEGHSRWIVQICPCRLCKAGTHVAVNERSVFDPEQARHILRSNLERCR